LIDENHRLTVLIQDAGLRGIDVKSLNQPVSDGDFDTSGGQNVESQTTYGLSAGGRQVH
jgi:hypothetical protein